MAGAAAGAAAAPAPKLRSKEWPSGLLVFRWHEPPRLVLRRSEFRSVAAPVRSFRHPRSAAVRRCRPAWQRLGRVGMGGGWRRLRERVAERSFRGRDQGRQFACLRMSDDRGAASNLRAGVRASRDRGSRLCSCCGRESGAGTRTSNRARQQPRTRVASPSQG